MQEPMRGAGSELAVCDLEEGFLSKPAFCTCKVKMPQGLPQGCHGLLGPAQVCPQHRLVPRLS